ncbi:amidophosphoribosyltransferase [Geothrix alkalitolerans]|uniref:amidophosphoribosyltransferase n=1 Tax=Geothrix alkalitolerans TaxID=2922724 RepID=UPI001FAF6CF4
MCGIAGVFEAEGATSIVSSILFAIQHRGQESCGAAARDAAGRIVAHKGMGLVKQVLDEEAQARLSGSTAIGHVRYPTAGCSDVANAQPHAIELAEGPVMAIASNGDLINYGELRARMERDGVVFKSDNDAELIGRLIALYHVRDGLSIEQAIARVQGELKGAFSTVLMYKDRLYAFRDPHGFRPFVIGHLGHEGEGEPASEGTVFASECCGFGIIGARRLREVKPGEILRLEKGRPVVSVASAPLRARHCVFELIYFSRPDSTIFGESVYQARERIGACMAAKDGALTNGEDLVVMPVPDSSNFIALGYARTKKAEFGMGLLRNHYVGRTFIKPTQASRDEGVKQKFNPLPDFFPGKRVVLIDDSIVRGTSLRKIVRMVRSAGAKEIHVRIGSPKVIGPCFYGIDTPTREELIANRMSEAEICEYLGADSLRWLDVADFEGLLPGRRQEFCTACFDLDYIYPPEGFAAKTNTPAAART